MDLRAAKRHARKHAAIVMVVRQRPFTFVKVSVQAPNSTVILLGMGFSKVMWPDRWDAERGCAIARGKAEVDAARQLVAREDGGGKG